LAVRVFTLEEANEALSAVRPLVARMVERARALAAAQARQATLHGHIAGNGGDLTPSELAAAAAAVQAERAAVSGYVEQIHALGVQVKDLGLGLVDFPSVRDGEDVLLCWQLGEDAVESWHRLDEGYAGRKPL